MRFTAALGLVCALAMGASASPRPRLVSAAPKPFAAFVRHLLRSPEGAVMTRNDPFWHELGSNGSEADRVLLGPVHEILVGRGQLVALRAALETPEAAVSERAAEALAESLPQEQRKAIAIAIAGAKAKAVMSVFRRTAGAQATLAAWEHDLGGLEAYLREFDALAPYHPAVTQHLRDCSAEVEHARGRLMAAMSPFTARRETEDNAPSGPISPAPVPPERESEFSLARPTPGPRPLAIDVVLSIQRRIDATEAAVMDRREKPLMKPTLLWFFLTGAVMNLLIPARNIIVTHSVAPQLWWLVTLGSVAFAMAALALYRSFRHLPRARLMRGTLLVLGASILPWWPLAAAFPGSQIVSLAFSFWSDTFTLMAISLAFMYFYDAFARGASKRKGPYILIALGLGSVLGAGLATLAVGPLGLSKLALIPMAFAVFSAAFAASRWAERRAADLPAKPTEPALAAADAKPADKPLKTIAKSPFLILLSLSVVFERMMPDFSDYLLKTATMTMSEPNLALFNTLYQLATNALGLVFSVAVFGLLKLKKGGMIIALASLPLVHLLGFAGFGLYATALGTIFHNGLEMALRISSFKLAVQNTYTEERQAVLLHVKPLIDNVFYRAARLPVGLFLGALILWGANVVQGVYIAGLIVSGVALPAAIGLGWLWERRKAAREAAEAARANR